MKDTILTKMSVKALGCNPKKVAAKDDSDVTPVVLCKIAGKATGLIIGEDSGGKVWTAIGGDFIGVNTQAGSSEFGKVYRSGKLFLPGGIQEMIELPLRNADRDGKNLTVEFALEVRAVKASNPIGYSYQAESLRPVEAYDELSEFKAMVGLAPAPAPAGNEAPAQIEAPAPPTEAPAAPPTEAPAEPAKPAAAAAAKKK